MTINVPETQPRPTDNPDRETRAKNDQATTERRLVWATIALAVATLAVAIISLFQLRVLDRHAVTFEGLHAAMLSGLDETRKVAAAAKTSADAASDSIHIAEDGLATHKATLATNKIIERAYVSMSHYGPGLQFIASTQDIRATIKLTNNGHTPADIIGYDFTLVHIPLIQNPNRPQVPDHEPFFSIMPNDFINLWANVPSSVEVWQQLQAGTVPAFLIGWVVYRDRFLKRHLSGYGRRFVMPHPGMTPQELADWNNLVYVEVPGYSYEEDLD